MNPLRRIHFLERRVGILDDFRDSAAFPVGFLAVPDLSCLGQATAEMIFSVPSLLLLPMTETSIINGMYIFNITAYCELSHVDWQCAK